MTMNPPLSQYYDVVELLSYDNDLAWFSNYILSLRAPIYLNLVLLFSIRPGHMLIVWNFQ